MHPLSSSGLALFAQHEGRLVWSRIRVEYNTGLARIIAISVVGVDGSS